MARAVFGKVAPVHWVVRAGIARAADLIVGSRPHRDVPGLSGFSVQSAPDVSVEELARAGGFRNLRISVTTADAQRRHGFDIVLSTPGKGGYHATVRTRYPLPLDAAVRLSGLFNRLPNPYPVP